MISIYFPVFFEQTISKIPFSDMETLRHKNAIVFCLSIQMWLLCVPECVVQFSPVYFISQMQNCVVNIFIQCFPSQTSECTKHLLLVLYITLQNIFHICVRHTLPYSRIRVFVFMRKYHSTKIIAYNFAGFLIPTSPIRSFILFSFV